MNSGRTGTDATGGACPRHDGRVPRVLLVLPTATYRADAFLAAARRLGVSVVTASERRQALAEVMGDRFLEIPLDDPRTAGERIAALAERSPLDAVLAVDDQGLLAAAHAAERLGLPHSPIAALAATRDKAEMRARLARAGVAQPPFVACAGSTPEAVADAVGAAGAALGFPVVIKPTGLSGSRGVIRADDPVAARAATARILALLREIAEPPALLVERYVDGAEVALEGVLRNGTLQTLAVFDKPDPLVGPFFEETIYVTPARHEPALLDAIAETLAAACAALGLVEGPVHGEVRLAADVAGPRPVVLEVAARTIGGRCAAALRFSAETSLEEIVLLNALGRPLPEGGITGASGVMMIPIPASGRLVAVEGTERAAKVAGVSGCEITIPPGGQVVALPEGDRYLGFLFARGDTPEAVVHALRSAHGELEIVIEPEPAPVP